MIRIFSGLALAMTLPLAAQAGPPGPAGPLLGPQETGNGVGGCIRLVVPGPCCHAGWDVLQCH